MERAIRRISVERGHDPRFFTLLAFGGGGPLHACDLATSLQIPRVFIPVTPGVLSALGMLVAAPARDYARTVMIRLVPGDTTETAPLTQQFQALHERALADLVADGQDPADTIWHYQVDMRYLGQSHELTVDCDPTNSVEALIDAFHRAHEQRYSYRQVMASLELVTVRLTATVPIQPPQLRAIAGQLKAPLASEMKSVWFAGYPVETPLHRASAAWVRQPVSRPGPNNPI